MDIKEQLVILLTVMLNQDTVQVTGEAENDASQYNNQIWKINRINADESLDLFNEDDDFLYNVEVDDIKITTILFAD